MRSKTSCSEYFNKTLFRRNLTRFWPLWGMATFLACLAPLAVLTQIMWSDVKSLKPLEVTEMYYAVVHFAVPIISLLYAILCAMAVWSYLYNARSAGMCHTLPIRREGLLVTNFLSGMAMLIIPYAASGTLCILIFAAMGGFDLAGTLVTILCVLGLNFFYFCTATFTAFITGNIFALPALYFLLHFLAVMLDGLLGLLARGFLLGFVDDYSGTVEFLSPTVFFVNNLAYAAEYTEELVQLPGRGSYTHNVLTAIHPGNYWLIAVYALVGVGLLVLAWLLYRRRASERAGEVAAAKWMHPAYRALATALCAMIGGQLLYLIFWSGNQSGDFYDAIPLAVCMAVAGIIGYFAASMLLAKSLKVFHKKRFLGAAGAAVFAAALCLGLDADVLGIEKTVPHAAADLESMRISVAGNSYDLASGKDDAVIEKVLELHRAIVEDGEYIVSSQSWWDNTVKGRETFGWTNVHLRYLYQNGKTLQRSYSMPMTRERVGQAGTYDNLLDVLVNGGDMKLRRLHVGDEELTVSDGWFRNEVDNSSTDLGTREAQAILDAVRKDAEAGTWGTYDWFSEGTSGSHYAMDLNLAFRDAEDKRSDVIQIVVRKGMEHTVKCLKTLGLVTDETLKTYRELYPEDYKDYYDTDVSVPMAEVIYPGDAYVSPSEDAAIGIIGGADGQTAMYVTD